MWKEPGRDPRGRFITTVYTVTVPAWMPAQAADDAASLVWLPTSTALDVPLAFDHSDILAAAIGTRRGAEWGGRHRPAWGITAQSANGARPRGCHPGAVVVWARPPNFQGARPMKHIVAGHRAGSDTDFLELALGTPVELWLGEEDETEEETAARLAAARDIIADDPGLFDRTTALAVETIGRTWLDTCPGSAAPVVPARRRPRRAAAA